jgi:hypothetical protein
MYHHAKPPQQSLLPDRVYGGWCHGKGVVAGERGVGGVASFVWLLVFGIQTALHRNFSISLVFYKKTI